MSKLRLTGLLLTRLLGLLLMYVSCVQVGYAQQSGGGNYPAGNGIRVKEVDGSPNVPGTQTLVFPNGSLTRAGQTVTVTIAGGTTINSTNGQVPYRVNSTTFGDSAFASNALNSTYLSATSGASGAGLTLAVAGGGTNENLILTPKGTGTILVPSSATRAAISGFASTDGLAFNAGEPVIVRSSAIAALFNSSGWQVNGAYQYGFNTSTGLASPASGVLRVSNFSIGAGQLLIGTSTDTADAQLSVYSQSTTRPGLKLRALTATSGSQNMDEVYDASGTLSYAVRADGKIVYVSGNTATTVGAAGGASALPATPTGYLQVVIGGTTYKLPYYAN